MTSEEPVIATVDVNLDAAWETWRVQVPPGMTETELADYVNERLTDGTFWDDCYLDARESGCDSYTVQSARY